MDIVLKLRELRRLRHLSQKEAAEQSGIGEKTLSSFETGQRVASMRLSQLLRLLSTYDMTPAEFFGDGVEQSLFAELADLSPEELEIVTAWRAVPAAAQPRLAARFLDMMAGVSIAAEPRLRAVR